MIEIGRSKSDGASLVVDLEKCDHVLFVIDDREGNAGFYAQSFTHFRQEHRVMCRVVRQIVDPMLNEPTCPAHARCAMIRQRYNSRSLKKVAARHPLRCAQAGTTTLSPGQLKQLLDQSIQQTIQI